MFPYWAGKSGELIVFQPHVEFHNSAFNVPLSGVRVWTAPPWFGGVVFCHSCISAGLVKSHECSRIVMFSILIVACRSVVGSRM